MSLRHIPVPKDGDAQDALDMWEMEARNRGVVFVDDSPENLKAPSSFNQFTSLDLTRTQEIQARYTLAQQMKIECWELIGMSKQRMGSIAASETAQVPEQQWHRVTLRQSLYLLLMSMYKGSYIKQL